MKKLLATAVFLAATAAQASTTVGFTGDYGVPNWATDFTSPCTSCFTIHSASDLTLGGADGDDDLLDHFTDSFITVPTNATITFDWDYRTEDDPAYDPFGVITDNGSGLLFTQLSDDIGGSPQSGTRSFVVAAGDVFGFRVWSIGSEFGAATGHIGNFRVDVVPEPTTLALLVIALAAGAATRRRDTRV